VHIGDASLRAAALTVIGDDDDGTPLAELIYDCIEKVCHPVERFITIHP
jgi:hypothetical protein